jgi:hypothetical protein
MKGMYDCGSGVGLFADGVKSESGYRSFSPFQNS